MYLYHRRLKNLRLCLKTDPVGSADEVATLEFENEAESVAVTPPSVDDDVAGAVVESAADESVFELSDGFDGDEFSLDEQPDSREDALEPAKKSRDEGGDREPRRACSGYR